MALRRERERKQDFDYRIFFTVFLRSLYNKTNGFRRKKNKSIDK
jgi:hypothetical protein